MTARVHNAGDRRLPPDLRWVEELEAGVGGLREGLQGQSGPIPSLDCRGAFAQAAESVLDGAGLSALSGDLRRPRLRCRAPSRYQSSMSADVTM